MAMLQKPREVLRTASFTDSGRSFRGGLASTARGRVLLTLWLAVVTLLLVGCGHPWAVVSQQNPTPMQKSSRFTVEKLGFEDLRVGEKSDQEYASEKEQKTADAWQGDKVEMQMAFAHGFTDEQEPLMAGDNGDFVVKVNCGFIEPGFYAYVASAPAEVRIRAKIFDRQGKLLDEIEIRTRAGDLAKRSRLRQAAASAGAALAQYLKERLGT